MVGYVHKRQPHDTKPWCWTKLAIAGAFVGTVIGIFLGLPGLILGPFVGAAAGELISNRDLSRAGKVGLGTWIGMVFGAAAKLALAFSML